MPLSQRDVVRARQRLQYVEGYSEARDGRLVHGWLLGPSSLYCTRARGTPPPPAGGHAPQDEEEAGGRGLAGAPTPILPRGAGAPALPRVSG